MGVDDAGELDGRPVLDEHLLRAPYLGLLNCEANRHTDTALSSQNSLTDIQLYHLKRQNSLTDATVSSQSKNLKTKIQVHLFLP